MTPPRDPLATLQLEVPRALSERVIAAALAACALISILTTAGIVGVLLLESARFFGAVSLEQFLADTQWTPLFADKHFGIWPLLVGTMLTSAIAIAVAVPLGLLAAIYLAEFASERVRRGCSCNPLILVILLRIERHPLTVHHHVPLRHRHRHPPARGNTPRQ